MTAEQNHGDMDRRSGRVTVKGDPYFPQALEAWKAGDEYWFKAFVHMSREWRFGFLHGCGE